MTTFTPEAIEAALDAFHNDPAWREAMGAELERDFMSRALTAADAAMEAAGWVRVPVEPTIDHVAHAIYLATGSPRAPEAWAEIIARKSQEYCYWRAAAFDAWRAMIAARPKDKG
jgi:hypothetical protein